MSASGRPMTFLHYAPNGNISSTGTYLPGAYGFNLADVATQAKADALPSGVQALLFTGTPQGLTSTFESLVNSTATDAHVWGYFVASSATSGNAANIKAEADYIHAHAPGKDVFIVAKNSGTPDAPKYGVAPASTDADLVGAAAYPNITSTYDAHVIPNAVSALEAKGWTQSQLVPVYQEFGGGTTGDAVPTSAQVTQDMQQWGSVVPTPAFDYAESFGVLNGGSSIKNTAAFQTLSDQQNALTAPSTSWHYAPNGNFANGAFNAPGDPGSDGFNLADASSQALADSLPSGDKALVFLPVTGDTSSFEATINAAVGDTHILGWYLGDDVPDSDAALIKAEADYINAHDSGHLTFIVPYNDGTDASPKFGLTPSNTDVQYAGEDAYPVQAGQPNGMNLSYIGDRVNALEAAGWSQGQLIPTYQAFGAYPGGNWNMPSQSQETAIMNTLAGYMPSPKFDYAYSWGQQSGDQSLSGSSALQQVFAAHNA